MEKIQIEDILKYKFLSSPLYSPSGKNRCFVLSECDKENNGYKSFIYMMKDGAPYRLSGLGKESSFIFLDDDTILFASDRSDKKEENKAPKTIFYRLSLKGGEAEEYFSVPIFAGEIVKIGDERFVLSGSINTAYPDFYKASEDEAKKILKEIDDNKDYREISETPFVMNGEGFTNGQRNALFIYDHKNNSLKRLTGPYFELQSFTVSKDNKEILFTGGEFKTTFNDADIKLYHLSLETKKIVQVKLDKGMVAYGALYADDFAYLIIANTNHIGENSNPDIYTVDSSLKIKKICDLDHSIGSSILTDVEKGGGMSSATDHNYLYFTTTENENGPVWRINKDGIIEKIYESDGATLFFDVKDGHLFMVNLEGMRPEEVYDEKKRLSFFNDEALKGKYLAKPESLTFINESKDEIHGYALKPFGYQKGNKYPAVLDVHGGPKCAYGAVFFHEMQVWSSLGYFVIFANPTGSDGRGDKFSDIRGKYGTVDYNDLMTFVDECLKKYPEIDSENLFETGGSYGGFMTNWIIGHTNRFKACASQRSISNWSIMYGISDIGVEFTLDQQASDPFNNPEKCWWHSPLRYADKVKTPTLFIHSDEDYRCPLQEGLSMFTAIRNHGVESKIVIFKGENHELSRGGKPLHRIKRLSEITNWFESHRSDKINK